MIARYRENSVPFWYQDRMGWRDRPKLSLTVKEAAAALIALGEAFAKANVAMNQWWEANRQDYLCQPAELKEFRS